jgi:peptidoglycan/LPS O-acetylase OafA/YrhL
MKNSSVTSLGTAPLLPSRIPTLDGLRAVSILCVIIGHATDERLLPSVAHIFVHLGNLGVKMFFVISGFLITTLLLKEAQQTGAVSLKKFYIRRSLRIFPAFFVFVFSVLFLSKAGLITLRPGDFLHAITYTMNYHLDRAWAFNHLWSLSVEEQFYFLWPGVFVLLGSRRAIFGAVFVIIAGPLIRWAMFDYFDASATAMTRHFQSVADALAAGCLLAGAYNLLGSMTWYARFSRSLASVVLPCMILAGAAAAFRIDPYWFYVPGQTLVNLAIFVLVERTIRNPADWIGTVLNFTPVAFVGALSYSLYLWQEIFLDYSADGLGIGFPSNVVATFFCAILSYYVVEKPFLRMKTAFSAVRTGSAQAMSSGHA